MTQGDADLERAAFRAYCEAWGVRFGFGDEIAAYSTRTHSGVRNSMPPRELWPNILPTIRLAEELREHFGPTRILSAYRSPAYNAVIDGSAKDSQHVRFTALDLVCVAGTPREWAAFLRSRRSAGAFKGGIGTYRTFVHVDTRGHNADWGG